MPIWADFPLPETTGKGAAAHCVICNNTSALKLVGDDFVCRDANRCRWDAERRSHWDEGSY